MYGESAVDANAAALEPKLHERERKRPFCSMDNTTQKLRKRLYEFVSYNSLIRIVV